MSKPWGGRSGAAHDGDFPGDPGCLDGFALSEPGKFDIETVSQGVWNLQAVQDYMVGAVSDILARRGVPKSATISPLMELTIPAIEAMRYSPLRREIAALVASSMDARHRDRAHPAFLVLLQELTRDEIAILGALPDSGRYLPIANLSNQVTRGYFESVYRNIIPAELASRCSAPSRIPTYVDNLRRLQLVGEPAEYASPDSGLYEDLLRQGFCARLLNERGRRTRLRIERRLIGLTDFGAAFRDSCIA